MIFERMLIDIDAESPQHVKKALRIADTGHGVHTAAR